MLIIMQRSKLLGQIIKAAAYVVVCIYTSTITYSVGDGLKMYINILSFSYRLGSIVNFGT